LQPRRNLARAWQYLLLELAVLALDILVPVLHSELAAPATGTVDRHLVTVEQAAKTGTALAHLAHLARLQRLPALVSQLEVLQRHRRMARVVVPAGILAQDLPLDLAVLHMDTVDPLLDTAEQDVKAVSAHAL